MRREMDCAQQSIRKTPCQGFREIFTCGASQAAANALSQETGASAAHTDSGDRDASIARVKAAGRLVVNAGALEHGDSLSLDPDAIDRLFRINIHSSLVGPDAGIVTGAMHTIGGGMAA
jgi:cyclic-di-GMP-binding biofilm dispersal mediator protein